MNYANWPASLIMKSEEIRELFPKEMDADVLDRMPEWFKRLREAYLKK